MSRKIHGHLEAHAHVALGTIYDEIDAQLLRCSKNFIVDGAERHVGMRFDAVRHVRFDEIRQLLARRGDCLLLESLLEESANDRHAEIWHNHYEVELRGVNVAQDPWPPRRPYRAPLHSRGQVATELI